ncbi:peptidase inhibitor family I36 protein [Streptomyces sp. DSM 44915]|uniref:Peptidase inhibitor family I36 protein n=1 Tax=Streptomyces chisholmiae TaxID=3075540 RepID=A0ABU2JVC3_9ACTN|nr:peptidase inhibitor family I36 protein [Streptomyces sp. DSM 44915]MDT0268708.1 peptidase inhibitor family I36 protein [Streptomyces sp. DSM 44915]
MSKRTAAPRWLAVGAAIAFATGTATLSAQPALADSSQCASGSFCVWEKSSYAGEFLQSSGSVTNVGNGMNDRMTSYWNRTNQTVSVYEHDNHTGCMFSIAPGESEAAVASHFNDKMTSFKVGGGC